METHLSEDLTISCTASRTMSAANSISSLVVNLPSPNRIDWWAWSSVSPNASSTWDGSTACVVQADPADIATLSDTEFMTAFPSISGNLTLRLWGSLFVGWPLSMAPASETFPACIWSIFGVLLFRMTCNVVPALLLFQSPRFPAR